MKNKGFTLVELLAVIVIIALIGGLGLVAYNSIIRQSEIRVYEAYENTMHAETIELLSKHVELIPKKGIPTKYYLSDIKIDPINNPRNRDDYCNSSYVEVTRNITDSGLDTFTYKVCLICLNYNSDESECKTFEN